MSKRSHRRSHPSPEQFAVLMSRRLDWSELDSLGHANNARYFTWFEEARMALFVKVGVPVTNEQGWGPILAHTSCDFLAPVCWPANLLLGARITRIGSSSFGMEYAVFEESSSLQESSRELTDQLSPVTPQVKCVAVGEGVIVLIHYETGEKVEIEGVLRACLTAYLSDSPPS